MDHESGLFGTIYTASVWIMRFVFSNVLWIILNLPIVFVLFNILFMEQQDTIYPALIIIALLMPFFFFPATTALFATVRSWIIPSVQSEHLIRTYFSYYKQNYVKSLLAGLIFTVVWSILIVDVMFLSTVNDILMYFFIVIGIILFVFTINFFSVTAHYKLSLKESFKNAFLFTIGNPLFFLLTIMSIGLFLYVSFNWVLYLLIFVTWSLIAYVSFLIFYRNFLTLMKKKVDA